MDFALDASGDLALACSASSKNRYFCPECLAPVRACRGFFRKPYFSHHLLSSNCRKQVSKSQTHRWIQEAIQQELGPSCHSEYFFRQIGRVADLFWEERGIIFEVQCSSITPEEVAARDRDYRSVGFCLIWILHTRLYDKAWASDAEKLMRKKGAYYTAMRVGSQLLIYDRVFPGVKKSIDLRGDHQNIGKNLSERRPFLKRWRTELQRRFENWVNRQLLKDILD